MITVWLLYDIHKKGSENQCLGLAKKLGLNFNKYPIKIALVWRYLPRFLWPRIPYCLDPSTQLNLINLPKIIIASGRASAAIAADLKKHYKVKVIYILNPKMPSHFFDWIITPKHDQLTGPKVLEVLGSLHGHNFDHSSDTISHWQKLWDSLPKPHIAVLIGGPNKYYNLSNKILTQVAHQLKILHHIKNISLLITFSRRTTQKQRHLFTNLVQDIPHWIWDEQHPNPYFDMLNQAEFILITGDSIAMISEACGSGKPVYVIKLEGYSKKFELFYKDMLAQNHIRFF